MTCDALAHFSAFDSDLKLFLVNIQGIISTAIRPQDGGRGSKVLNLFDLMFYSFNKSFGLGDAGNQGIQGFFVKHKCNDICSALDLPAAWGCDRATLDEAHVEIMIGHGLFRDPEPEEPNFDSDINAGAQSFSGQVEFEPLSAHSVQTLIYSPVDDLSFEIGGYLCHPVCRLSLLHLADFNLTIPIPFYRLEFRINKLDISLTG